MKMNKYLLPLIGIAIVAMGCDNSENTSESNSEKQEIVTTEDSVVIQEEIVPTISVEDTVLLLFPGDYSDGSIESYALNNNWEALKSNGDYLAGAFAQIATSVIDSPWEEEGNLQGINISDKSEQPVSIYISGINSLIGVNMLDVSGKMHNKRLLPGESFKIGEYTLTANGDTDGDDDYPQVSNYRLTLSGMKNDQYIEQEIVFQEFFDDAMINFHWIGDLDQDGIPDMLIDTSHKYSYSNPTLFLSSPSGKNSLVKKVAESTRYGC